MHRRNRRGARHAAFRSEHSPAGPGGFEDVVVKIAVE